MARWKDENWGLMTPNPPTDHAQLAVLMDIRDELKRLNTLLHCYKFVGIPDTLQAIRRKLPTRRKQKRANAPKKEKAK